MSTADEIFEEIQTIIEYQDYNTIYSLLNEKPCLINMATMINKLLNKAYPKEADKEFSEEIEIKRVEGMIKSFFKDKPIHKLVDGYDPKEGKYRSYFNTILRNYVKGYIKKDSPSIQTEAAKHIEKDLRKRDLPLKQPGADADVQPGAAKNLTRDTLTTQREAAEYDTELVKDPNVSNNPVLMAQFKQAVEKMPPDECDIYNELRTLSRQEMIFKEALSKIKAIINNNFEKGSTEHKEKVNNIINKHFAILEEKMESEKMKNSENKIEEMSEEDISKTLNMLISEIVNIVLSRANSKVRQDIHRLKLYFVEYI